MSDGVKKRMRPTLRAVHPSVEAEDADQKRLRRGNGEGQKVKFIRPESHSLRTKQKRAPKHIARNNRQSADGKTGNWTGRSAKLAGVGCHTKQKSVFSCCR